MQKNSAFQVASFGVNPLKVDFDAAQTLTVSFSSFDSTFFFLNRCFDF